MRPVTDQLGSPAEREVQPLRRNPRAVLETWLTRGCSLAVVLLMSYLVWDYGGRDMWFRVTADSRSSDWMKKGLVLWLDAEQATPVMGGETAFQLSAWHDRSGRGNSAFLTENGSVRWLPHAVAGRPAIEFDGSGFLVTEPIRVPLGPVSVFVVSHRPASMSNQNKWQRLVSSWDRESPGDNKMPSFCLTRGTVELAEPCETVVDEVHLPEAVIGGLGIGGNVRDGSGLFHGMICEVMVFDQNFINEAQVATVRNYLSTKWQAKLACLEHGWNRIGELENPPVRSNGEFPLSDQQNSQEWIKQNQFSDEFEGEELDEKKWWKKNPDWLGRPPAFFSAENVAVSDGQLQLTFRRDTPPEELIEKGFRNYSSASVVNREWVKYGYFEIFAKPMRSAASSSFYLSTGMGKETATEIDVFELGGNALWRKRFYQTNVHVFHTPTNKTPWRRERRWIAPWDLADDFHVYGLDWNEQEIVYYVDGVPVRRLGNTHWHHAMKLVIDTESMFGWLGTPVEADLPSTYKVKYVRCWKRRLPLEKHLPTKK